jgi:hypothetical protein
MIADGMPSATRASSQRFLQAPPRKAESWAQETHASDEIDDLLSGFAARSVDVGARRVVWAGRRAGACGAGATTGWRDIGSKLS